MRTMLPAFLLLLVVLAVVPGCAKNGTMVVLTPDPDGKVGAATVSTRAGSVTIDAPNQATIATDSSKPPDSPAVMRQETIDSLFTEALSIQPKPPIHYLLYFEKDLALTAESTRLLPEVIAAIRERKAVDISVVGHTDSVGSREYNLTLSRNRAESVKELLVHEGVKSDHITTTSHGKENPLVKTEDNVIEPRNRRVEVVVR